MEFGKVQTHAQGVAKTQFKILDFELLRRNKSKQMEGEQTNNLHRSVFLAHAFHARSVICSPFGKCPFAQNAYKEMFYTLPFCFLE